MIAGTQWPLFTLLFLQTLVNFSSYHSQENVVSLRHFLLFLGHGDLQSSIGLQRGGDFARVDAVGRHLERVLLALDVQFQGTVTVGDFQIGNLHARQVQGQLISGGLFLHFHGARALR